MPEIEPETVAGPERANSGKTASPLDCDPSRLWPRSAPLALGPSLAAFRSTLFVRAVSVALCLLMVTGDPSWAAGISDFILRNFSTDLRNLSVPSRLGTITDRWNAGSVLEAQGSDVHLGVAAHSPEPRAPLVVLIQDLHANIGVQKNIAGILEHLYGRYRISQFYTEAAFGSCEVTPFRTLPKRGIQNQLIDRLLSKALLTGSEIAAMQVGRGALSPVKVTGVDDALLYLANVQAFRDLVAVGPQAAREWRGMKEFLAPGASPDLRHHLELVEKLMSLKLEDYEWLQYKAHRAWTPQGSSMFRQAITAGERFYTAAEARDGAMADNLLTALGAQGWGLGRTARSAVGAQSPEPRAVALVTGGFHTATIAHALKQQGISFTVVTPEVERLDQEELYIRSLTEPPHETVAALLSTAHAIGYLKPLMGRIPGMSKMWTWVTRRETLPLQSIGRIQENYNGGTAYVVPEGPTLWQRLWSFLARVSAAGSKRLVKPALALGMTLVASVTASAAQFVTKVHTVIAPSGQPSIVTDQVAVVAHGDSLHKIVAQIHQANPASTVNIHALYHAGQQIIGSNPDLIHPGQALPIPGTEHVYTAATHVVQPVMHILSNSEIIRQVLQSVLHSPDLWWGLGLGVALAAGTAAVIHWRRPIYNAALSGWSWFKGLCTRAPGSQKAPPVAPVRRVAKPARANPLRLFFQRLIDLLKADDYFQEVESSWSQAVETGGPIVKEPRVYATQGQAQAAIDAALNLVNRQRIRAGQVGTVAPKWSALWRSIGEAHIQRSGKGWIIVPGYRPSASDLGRLPARAGSFSLSALARHAAASAAGSFALVSAILGVYLVATGNTGLALDLATYSARGVVGLLGYLPWLGYSLGTVLLLAGAIRKTTRKKFLAAGAVLFVASFIGQILPAGRRPQVPVSAPTASSEARAPPRTIPPSATIPEPEVEVIPPEMAVARGETAAQQLRNVQGARNALRIEEPIVQGERKARENQLLTGPGQLLPEKAPVQDPSALLAPTIRAIQAFNPTRLTDLTKALRADPNTSWLAQDPHLAALDQFAASWQETLRALQQIQAAGPNAALEKEAVGLVQQENATLALADHNDQVVSGLDEIANLLATRAQELPLSLKQALDEARESFRNGKLELAQTDLQALRNAWTGLTSWEAAQVARQAQAAEAERQANALRVRLETQDIVRTIALPAAEWRTIAEDLQVAAGDIPLKDLVQDGTNLLGGLRMTQKNPAMPAWAGSLEQARDALRTIQKTHDQLVDEKVDDPAKHEALRQALLAFQDLQAALPGLKVFDVNDPQFAKDLDALPKEPATLAPESRVRFDAFMAGHPELSAEKNPQLALQAWYQDYFERLTRGVAPEHLHGLLLSAIAVCEEQTNLENQVEQRLAGAQADEKAAALLQTQIDHQKVEHTKLLEYETRLKKQIQDAEKQAPDINTAGQFKLDPKDLDDYAKVLATFRERVQYAKPKGEAKDQEQKALKASIDGLQQAVENAQRSLHQPNGRLSPQQTDELTVALFGVLNHFSDLINPNYVKLETKGRARHLFRRAESTDSLSALQKFIEQTARYSVEYLGGLSQARLSQNATPDETVEERSIRLLGQVMQSAELSSKQQAYVRELERTSGIGNWWNVMQILNLAYGVKFRKDNWNTFVGRNPFAFTIGQANGAAAGNVQINVGIVKPVSTGSAALGSANVLVNATGAVENAEIVVSGKEPLAGTAFVAANLDPKVFSDLKWTVQEKGGVVPGGTVAFGLPDGKLLTAPKPLSANEMNPDHWQAVDAKTPVTGRFVANVKGQLYVWVAGRTPVSVAGRVKAMVETFNGAILSGQILKGFASGQTFRYSLSKVPAPLLARYAAGLQVHGMGRTLVQLIDAARFEKAAWSKSGGFLPGAAPRWIGNVTVKMPTLDGKTRDVVMRIDDAGEVLFERTDETGVKVLDDANGTVIYREVDGNVQKLTDIFFRWRLHSVQYFQVSDKLAKKSLGYDGYHASRRPHSAPVIVKDADHIIVQGADGDREYVLGKATKTQLDKKEVEARPYYDESKDPAKAPADYRGFILANALSDAATAKKVIDPKAMYAYVVSLEQGLDYFHSLVQEGSWQKIESLEASLTEGQWPKPNDPHWEACDGGVQRYVDDEGDITYLKWTDLQDKNHARTYIVDQHDPLHQRFFRMTPPPNPGAPEVWEERVAGLQGYARTKTLANSEGDWFLEDYHPNTSAKPGPADLELHVAGSPDALLWQAADGNWRLHVPKTEVVGGVQRRAGTWHFQPGTWGAEAAEAAIGAPLIRRQSLPILPDFERLIADGGGRKVQIGGETWYILHKVLPGKENRELSATFVVYQRDGQTRADYLSPSQSGLTYDKAGLEGVLPTYDQLQLAPPQDANHFTWFHGNVPPVIQGFLGSNAPAKAEYAFNPVDGGIYVKVTAGSGTPEQAIYYFKVQPSIAGQAAGASEKRTKTDFLTPMGQDVPDELVRRLPGYRANAFVKRDGQWFARGSSVHGNEAELSPLQRPMRKYKTMDQIRRESPYDINDGFNVMGHLPAYLGQGAKQIKGHWYQERHTVGNRSVWDWQYFEVDPNGKGGSYIDQHSGESIYLPPGEVLALKNTPVSASNYIAFNEGQAGQWGVPPVDEATLVAAYARDKRDKAAQGLPGLTLRQAPVKPGEEDTSIGMIPGTTISGRMLVPTRVQDGTTFPDPNAPLILRVLTEGTLVLDSKGHTVHVTPGQDLIYQVPLAHQERVQAVLRDHPEAVALLETPSHDVQALSVAGMGGVMRVKDLNSDKLHLDMFPKFTGDQKTFEDAIRKAYQEAISKGLTGDALVQIDDAVRLKGQVLIEKKGYKALAKYLDGDKSGGGLGYVQMYPGLKQAWLEVEALRKDGKLTKHMMDHPVALSGWMGIGKGIPGGLALNQLLANMRPVDPNDLNAGWILFGRSTKDPKEESHPIGTIIFGTKSSKGDPHLTGDQVALYPTDPDALPQYLTKEDYEKNYAGDVTEVIRVHDKKSGEEKWMPAVRYQIQIKDRDGKVTGEKWLWRLLGPDPKDPTHKVLIPIPTEKPAYEEPPGRPLYPKGLPLGYLTWDGQHWKVDGIIGFGQKFGRVAPPAMILFGSFMSPAVEKLLEKIGEDVQKAGKTVSNMVEISDEDKRKSPYPERYKHVMTGEDGVPKVKVDPVQGETRVTFASDINDLVTVDTIKQGTLFSREYYSSTAEDERYLQYTVYFGPRGETEPLYRVTVRHDTQTLKILEQNGHKVDEVYSLRSYDEKANWLAVDTIRLLRPDQFDYHSERGGSISARYVQQGHVVEETIKGAPQQSPAQQQLALLLAARSQIDRGAVQVTDFYDTADLRNPRKIQERFQWGNTTWLVIPSYPKDAEGHYIKNARGEFLQTGSDTYIFLGGKMKDGASLPGDPAAEIAVDKSHADGSFNAAVSPPAKLKDLEAAGGSRLLNLKELKARLAEKGIVLDDNTYISRSRITTSWGPTYDEYRLAGDPRHILFIQGLDRRLNLTFEGEYPTNALLLDERGKFIGESRLASDTEADSIFTLDRIREIVKRLPEFGGDPKNFWPVMQQNFGIGSKTKLPTVELISYTAEGSSNKEVTYDPQKPRKPTRIYLAPVAAPAGREIARFTSEGDFAFNDWISEKDKSIHVNEDGRHISVPTLYGMVPRVLTIRSNGEYWSAVYDGTRPVTIPRQLKDIYGRPLTYRDTLALLQTHGASVDLQRKMSVVQEVSDRLAGATGAVFDPALAQQMEKVSEELGHFIDGMPEYMGRGLRRVERWHRLVADQRALHGMALRTRAASAWRVITSPSPDPDRLYLRVQKFWLDLAAMELQGMQASIYRIQSTDFRERQTKLWMTPDGRLLAETYQHETGQPFHNGAFFIGIPSIISGEERVYYDIDKIYRAPVVSVKDNEVIKQTVAIDFRPAGSTTWTWFRNRLGMKSVPRSQQTDVIDWEQEMQDPKKVLLHDSTYVDTAVETKTRVDLVRGWLTDLKAMLVILGMFGGLVALLGLTLRVARWLGIRHRKKDLAEEPPTHPQEEAQAHLIRQNVREFLAKLKEDQLVSRYGFPKGVAEVAKKNLIAYIDDETAKDHSIAEAFQSWFSYYTEDWINGVMNGGQPSRRGAEKPSWIGHPEGSGVKADEDKLRNLYLSFLISAAASNFKMEVPDFLAFLFSEAAQKMRVERGKWVAEQIGRWYKIMRANLVTRTSVKLPQESRLAYMDMRGDFRSQPWVLAYRHNYDLLPPNASPEGKTFIEKAHQAFFGRLGWGTTLHNFPWILPFLLAYLAPFWMFAFHWFGSAIAVLAVEGVLLAVSWGFRRFLGRSRQVENEALRESRRPGWSGRLVDDEQSMEAIHQAEGRILKVGVPFWSLVLLLNGAWNALAFRWLSVPTDVLRTSLWLGHAWTTWALILPNFILLSAFFVLGIFTYLYVLQPFWGGGDQAYQGVGKIHTHEELAKNFEKARGQFLNKILPAEVTQRLSEQQREMAWARAWNAILDNMYQAGRLSREDVQNHAYMLEQTSDTDFLAGRALKPSASLFAKPFGENVSIGQVNEDANDDLQFFINSLFMSMKRRPVWDRMLGHSVIIPVYEEDVLYPEFGDNGYNNKMKTGATFLTHAIRVAPDEWKNFVELIAKKPEYADSVTDLAAMQTLQYGQPLVVQNPALREEVGFWVSCQFQPLARTVRGMMNQRKALELLVRIEFHDATELLQMTPRQIQRLSSGKLKGKIYKRIQEKVDEKFQLIVAYQPYSDMLARAKNPRDVRHDFAKARIDGLNFLMRRYPAMEISYVVEIPKKPSSSVLLKLQAELQDVKNKLWDGEGWYAVLMREGKVVNAVRLPGSPVKDMGFAKVENQKVAMKFARFRAQMIDMNQDMDFAEGLKMPNLMEEFRDPSVYDVDLPETIMTRRWSLEGAYLGQSDSTFVTMVKNFLYRMGTLYIYGHPNVVDLRASLTETLGLGSADRVNEDIWSGMDISLHGGQRKMVNFVRAKKGRYVGVTEAAGFMQKLGAGAAEQAVDRYLRWLNSLPAELRDRAGWWGRLASVMVTIVKCLSHGFGAIGFMLRKYPIVITNVLYLLVMLSLGSGLFVAVPSELWVGLFGVWLSQMIGLPGWFQLCLQHGWIRGTREYVRLLPGMAPFFMFQVYTYSAGSLQGMNARAEYYKPERGPGLEHEPVMALYRRFKGTHLHKAFWSLALAFFGIFLWRSEAVIWSLPFILQALSGLVVPFIFNRGATPIDVGYVRWVQLVKDDWQDYADVMRQFITGHWVAVDEAILGETESLPKTGFGRMLKRIMFVLPMFAVMVFTWAFGAFVTPSGVRAGFKNYVKAWLVGLAGGLILFSPLLIVTNWVIYLGTFFVVFLGQVLLNALLKSPLKGRRRALPFGLIIGGVLGMPFWVSVGWEWYLGVVAAFAIVHFVLGLAPQWRPERSPTQIAAEILEVHKEPAMEVLAQLNKSLRTETSQTGRLQKIQVAMDGLWQKLYPDEHSQLLKSMNFNEANARYILYSGLRLLADLEKEKVIERIWSGVDPMDPQHKRRLVKIVRESRRESNVAIFAQGIWEQEQIMARPLKDVLVSEQAREKDALEEFYREVKERQEQRQSRRIFNDKGEPIGPLLYVLAVLSKKSDLLNQLRNVRATGPLWEERVAKVMQGIPIAIPEGPPDVREMVLNQIKAAKVFVGKINEIWPAEEVDLHRRTIVPRTVAWALEDAHGSSRQKAQLVFIRLLNEYQRATQRVLLEGKVGEKNLDILLRNGTARWWRFRRVWMSLHQFLLKRRWLAAMEHRPWALPTKLWALLSSTGFRDYRALLIDPGLLLELRHHREQWGDRGTLFKAMSRTEPFKRVWTYLLPEAVVQALRDLADSRVPDTPAKEAFLWYLVRRQEALAAASISEDIRSFALVNQADVRRLADGSLLRGGRIELLEKLWQKLQDPMYKSLRENLLDATAGDEGEANGNAGKPLSLEQRMRSRLGIELVRAWLKYGLYKRAKDSSPLAPTGASAIPPSSHGGPPVAVPSAPINPPLAAGNAPIRTIHRYALPGGAVVLTPLNEEQWKLLQKSPDQSLFIDSAGELQPNRPPGKKVTRNSACPLRLVNKMLGGVDLVQMIADIAGRNPGRTETHLSWGVGQGVSLTEIREQLTKRGISNVRLIGFGNLYTKRWEQAPAGTIFILDDADHLPGYFNVGEIDSMESNVGLTYLQRDDNGQRYVRHMNALRSCLNPEHGVIIHNFANETLLHELVGYNVEYIGGRTHVVRLTVQPTQAPSPTQDARIGGSNPKVDRQIRETAVRQLKEGAQEGPVSPVEMPKEMLRPGGAETQGQAITESPPSKPELGQLTAEGKLGPEAIPQYRKEVEENLAPPKRRAEDKEKGFGLLPMIPAFAGTLSALPLLGRVWPWLVAIPWWGWATAAVVASIVWLRSWSSYRFARFIKTMSWGEWGELSWTDILAPCLAIAVTCGLFGLGALIAEDLPLAYGTFTLAGIGVLVWIFYLVGSLNAWLASLLNPYARFGKEIGINYYLPVVKELNILRDWKPWAGVEQLRRIVRMDGELGPIVFQFGFPLVRDKVKTREDLEAYNRVLFNITKVIPYPKDVVFSYHFARIGPQVGDIIFDKDRLLAALSAVRSNLREPSEEYKEDISGIHRVTIDPDHVRNLDSAIRAIAQMKPSMFAREAPSRSDEPGSNPNAFGFLPLMLSLAGVASLPPMAHLILAGITQNPLFGWLDFGAVTVAVAALLIGRHSLPLPFSAPRDRGMSPALLLSRLASSA